MAEAAVGDLRGFIGPYTEWASAQLHGHFPRVEADHLSILGVVLVGAGSIAATLSTEHPGRLSLPLNIGGVVTDAFDGALARVCYGNDPDRLVRGNQIDSLSDFFKDLSMGISKIAVADRGRNKLRRSLAEIATLTTPIASFSRAYKETQGCEVNEHGNGYLEFVGTRAARTGLHAVASSNVRLHGVPLQPPLDAIIIAGNLTRIVKNMMLPQPGDEEISPESHQKAQFRTKFHGLSIVITGAGILAARRLPK